MGFLGVNGYRLMIDNDAAYELIIGIADGTYDSVSVIVEHLAPAVEAHTF